jgi:hypothetical protein
MKLLKNYTKLKDMDIEELVISSLTKDTEQFDRTNLFYPTMFILSIKKERFEKTESIENLIPIFTTLNFLKTELKRLMLDLTEVILKDKFSRNGERTFSLNPGWSGFYIEVNFSFKVNFKSDLYLYNNLSFYYLIKTFLFELIVC